MAQDVRISGYLAAVSITAVVVLAVLALGLTINELSCSGRRQPGVGPVNQSTTVNTEAEK